MTALGAAAAVRRHGPVAALTVLALVLRALGAHQSLYGDELFTYQIGVRPTFDLALDLITGPQEISPPLHLLLARWSYRLLDTPGAIRLVSLWAGTMTVPVVFALGARTVGERAGLVGAALFALSPFATFYAVEGRPYALMGLFVTCAAYAAVRACEEGAARAWWAAFAFASCAAAWTHYTCLFALLALSGWVLVARPRRWRALLAADLAAVAGFLPWLPSLIDDLGSPAEHIFELIAPTTFDGVASGMGRWAVGSPFSRLADVPGTPAALLLCVAAAVAAASVLRGPLRRPRAGVLLVVLLAAASPAGTIAYSVLGTDVFLARNLYASLPALALAAGALVAAPPRRLAAATTGAALAAFAAGAIAGAGPGNARPPYREVARYLDRTVAPGETVLEAAGLPYPGPPGRQIEVYNHGTYALLHAHVRGATARALAAARRDGRLAVVATGRTRPPGPGFRRLSTHGFGHRSGLRVDVYAPR